MSLNPNNVGTREACQRLTAAGIVLETEADWRHVEGGSWYLLPRDAVKSDGFDTIIPAPCFTDVWRELPEEYENKNGTLFHLALEKQRGMTDANYVSRRGVWAKINNPMNANPTDALIDLLIWVRKEIKP
jgi:hypothetical protein